MLRGLFEGPAPWIILAVVVLLFGATRLPALARSLGQSAKIFRNEVKNNEAPEGEKPDAAKAEAAPSATATPGAATSEAVTPADGTPPR
jgi:sec-independent protein translocase protein TatA